MERGRVEGLKCRCRILHHMGAFCAGVPSKIMTNIHQLVGFNQVVGCESQPGRECSCSRFMAATRTDARLAGFAWKQRVFLAAQGQGQGRRHAPLWGNRAAIKLVVRGRGG
eukprot:1160845-Pelagomonas_calceolata.AAC.3